MQKELAYGIHTVEKLLEYRPDKILNLYLETESKLTNIINLANLHGISIDYIKKNKLNELAENLNHQGVIAYIRSAELTEVEFWQLLAQHNSALILVLDGIQDPHNLGAIFRTAEAANVMAIISAKDNSVGITPSVRKVASGAADLVPFLRVSNLQRFLKQLKQKAVWLSGLALTENSTNIFTSDLTGARALVLGAEHQGLRRSTLEACDYLIKIPMQGLLESLNVSVAAGIALFEALRQRTNISS